MFINCRTEITIVSYKLELLKILRKLLQIQCSDISFEVILDGDEYVPLLEYTCHIDESIQL